MNTEIINIINQLLYEQNYVTLPSFGTFEIKQQSATIDPVMGKIHPPGGEVTFSPNIQSENQELRLSLIKHFGYSENEADKRITQFIRDIKTKLEQKEIVYLTGIGKVFLDHDDNISFVSTSSSHTRSDYGLPDVAYSPVAKGEKAPIQETPSSLGQKLQRSALQVLIAIAFIAIAATIYFDAKTTLQSSPLANTHQEVHINQKPSILPTPERIMENVTHIDMETEQADSPTKPQPAIEVEEDLNVDETKARTLKNNECIIIAGTFSKKENALNMINELIAIGYAPYKDKKGQNWRVGIIFNYNSVYEIKAHLEDLTRTYDTNAWILKK